MDQPLQALATDEQLVAATEANYRAYFAGFTILPRIQMWQEPTFTAFIANSPPGNSVLTTHFGEATVAAEIRDLLARLAPIVRFAWWQILPSCQPADLAEHLRAAGLKSLPDESRPVMTLALTTRPAAPPPPQGLVIRLVSDAATMHDWTAASMQGFETNAKNVQPYHDAYTALGFAEDATSQHFVGYLAGVPVTSATVLFAAGLAGIYDVSTAPSARRQGCGIAITEACLVAAEGRGYHHAVLQASPEGLGVYQRLGFHERYREQNFGWLHPDEIKSQTD